MRKIRFDNFEIDLDLFSLSKNGKPVDIGPRALDLLVCLIENHDRVVSRDFLREEIWKVASLSDATIPTCVMEARRALGDSAATPRLIVSIRGRGYRFVGEAQLSTDFESQSAQSASRQLPFIGRASQLKLLQQVFDQLESHCIGRIVVITGEAGIGKTRLLAEFMESASQRVAWVSAKSPRIEGCPPFWLWTTLLRDANDSGRIANPRLTAFTRELAKVFPEVLDQSLPRFESPPAIAKFAVIDQWIRAVKSMSESKPLILTFEDVHRADMDSLDLLACLAEEVSNDPILIIITQRPNVSDIKCGARISEISATPNAISIEVPALSIGEVTTLIDPLQEDRGSTGAALHRRTSGNAFYLTRVIQHFGTSRIDLSPEHLAREIPKNTGELVARQISGLPQKTHEVLSAASIFGDRFSPEELASLTDLAPAETAQHLFPARKAMIITEDGPDLSFAHSILRDALYKELNNKTRLELHEKAARALKDRPDARQRPAEIAHHLERSVPLSSRTESTDWLSQAGREAVCRFAYAEAASFYARALKSCRADRSATTKDVCALLLDLSRAVLYNGNREESRSLLLESARIARDEGHASALASCALALAPDFLTIEVGVLDAELVSILREALASIPESNTSLRCKLLARLSQAGQWAEPAATTEALAIESLAIARSIDDPDALVEALAARAESLHGPALASERLPLIQELGLAAQQSHNFPAHLLQITRSIAARLELGDIRGVESENEQYRSIAARAALPQYDWYPLVTDTMLAMMRGDINAAESFALAFKEAAGSAPDQNCIQAFACHSVIREMERDNSAAMIPFVRKFCSVQKHMYAWPAALAWLHWDAADSEGASRILSQLQADDFKRMSREPGGGVALALFAEAAARIGHRSSIESLSDLIVPLGGRCATIGYGVAYMGSFERYAGLLAEARGQADEATTMMQEACEAERRHGATSWLMYAEADLLRLEADRSRPITKTLERAKQLLAPAHSAHLPRANRVLREAVKTSMRKRNKLRANS